MSTGVALWASRVGSSNFEEVVELAVPILETVAPGGENLICEEGIAPMAEVGASIIGSMVSSPCCCCS